MMKPTEEIHKKLIEYNKAYRSGNPSITDSKYDDLVEDLRKIEPNHEFFNKIEPEIFENKNQVKHPTPMLSTEKAYTKEDLIRFVNRVKKEAKEINISDIKFRVTAKLDGLAGRDDGDILASRGNGVLGFNITSIFDKGVVPIGGRGLGVGEIVMKKSYFNENMADKFEHPRNLVVGISTSDTLNEFAKKALEDKSVHFVPYAKLPFWEGSSKDFIDNIDDIKKQILDKIDYPIDGMVAEVTNEKLKEYMGATAHHNRWQIAIKDRGETAISCVQNIIWQVGRTGSVTPVLEVEPIKLSGATIKRVSAHNAGFIRKKHLGIGAKIEIIRSGEVIPKIEDVIVKSDKIILPDICPECGKKLLWERDFLKCKNLHCSAQVVQRIYHWFKTLQNADWFGTKTIERIVGFGYDSIEKIYALETSDFENMEFGPVQSKNLFTALNTSKARPLEDFRFLAAFGINYLGINESRKLLSHIAFDDIFDPNNNMDKDNLTENDLIKISGFGEITAESIAKDLNEIKDKVLNMLNIGFNLVKSSLVSENLNNSNIPIFNKGIVFTGKMLKGKRQDMQNHARKFGAKVQTSVTGNTDFLVCGENVGAKKLEKAKALGIKILTENQYSEMVK